jgi:hypothetical protein
MGLLLLRHALGLRNVLIFGRDCAKSENLHRGIHREMATESSQSGFRHARKPLRSAVLLIRGADAWHADVEDISATGVLVTRPQGWQGKMGELYALDMIIAEELNIHVEAKVARITAGHIGFAYERIPADKEVPLWTLLGGYADKIEPFDD